ncbi:MAG TPA: hypothetical protein P5168_05380, partial [Candidatus Methanomethylicus sp.]|nr:hypothetical protein [Candidatus Methanomethylicus sp.]
MYKRTRLAAPALIVLLTVGTVCMTLGVGPAAGAMMPPPPTIAAKSAKLLDAFTGQVLYAANSEERMAPAS